MRLASPSTTIGSSLPYGQRARRCAGINLDEIVVGRLLCMEEVIVTMERIPADFASGKVVQPVRTMLTVVEHEGFLGLMPAYTGSVLG